MKKIIQLLSLIAIIMLCNQPIIAESEARRYVEKTVRIGWHVLEIIAGGYNAKMVKKIYQSKMRRSDDYFHMTLFSIGSLSLIGHGVYGINKELHIIPYTKKMYKKYVR